MSSLTRREYLVATGLSLAAACGRKHGAGFPGYAVIATSGDNSVSVVDLALFRLMKQVNVGSSPRAVLTGGPDETCFVLTPKTGSVHTLDSGFDRVNSRRLAEQVSDFRLSHDGKSLLAISAPQRELLAADCRTLQIQQRWKLPAAPVFLDVSVDGSVAISSGPAGTVHFVNSVTGQQSTCHLSGTLGEIRFRADGKLLLVANRTEHSIILLSVPTLQVIVDLPLGMEPENLCFDSYGGELFVSGKGMDGVAIVFPYDTLQVDQTVLAGHSPGRMVCSEQPPYLFVASSGGSDVCILSVDNRKMVGIVEVGQRPGFMAVTPDSQFALILNEASGDMAVIHVSSIAGKLSNAAIMRSKMAASLFTMFPVGSDPVHAAIVTRKI